MGRNSGHRGWGHVRQERSGRWSASYVGPDRQRHRGPTTWTRKMDAETWLGNQRRDIELEVWKPPAVVAADTTVAATVDTFGARWIKERDLKPRTRALYESLWRNHVRPKLGKVPIRYLTPETVRNWYAGLDGETATAKAHAYGLLRAVCATAASDGLLTANPCTIKGAGATSRKREPIILTPAEVAGLADAIKPERYRMLVLLSAWLGLRWGEVSELRVADVSAGCETITVARAVTHRSGVTRVDTTKSGKVRPVTVPPHIRVDLKHHLDTHVPTVPKSADAESAESPMLFPAASDPSKHLNDKVFAEALTKACKDIKRTGLHHHDLRHFQGTMVAATGATLAETMARLGHSTAKASLLYQSAVSGRDAEIAAALSELATAGPVPKSGQTAVPPASAHAGC